MNTFLSCKKEETNEQIFMTAKSSLQRLTEVAENHARVCDGKLEMKKITMKGHVAAMNMKCSVTKNHNMLWSSSPYLPDNEYLVNRRVYHGFICSGMLPVHYARFTNGVGCGKLGIQKRSQYFKSMKPTVKAEYAESIDLALGGEVAFSHEDGIEIMTDARHGWRKNAKDTSVVAIGEKTHNVLRCEHVTKRDDPISQRHERIGTERIYQSINAEGIFIKTHTHDRNLSINKFVRNTGNTVNQNDTWHGVKSIKAAMKKISSGPA